MLASAVFLLHAGVPQPPPPPDKASVDVLRTVLSDLQDYDRQGRPSEDRRISFELPEALVNQYLEIALAVTPRPMVEGLHLTLLGDNLCAVEARVDLDAVREAATLPLSKAEQNEFKGTKSLKAEIHFTVIAGRLGFQAKPLPSEVTPSSRVLTELIRVIAANQPEKIDTRRKVPLPFGLRRFWINKKAVGGET